MKQHKLLIFTALFLSLPHVLSAEKFEFRQNTGDKSRIVSTTEESVYENGKLISRSTIINRMASEVVKFENGAATLNASFNVAEEALNDDATKRLQWGEEYNSLFSRDAKGKITIDKKFFMPSARDLPLFPDRDLQPGDTWVSQGIEVFDLRRTFDIAEPYSVTFRAFNKYLGEKQWKQKTYKAFSINYNILHNVEGFENAPRTYMPRRGETRQPVKPGFKRITGKSSQTLYWDDTLGQIAAAEDSFELNFELTSGDVFSFRGKTVSEVIEAVTMDRIDVAHDVEEAIKELGLSDISVKVVDEGIAISLDNIQFEPDSAVLLNSEKTKLDKIGEVLQKYQNRDILVSGHTAQAGSSEPARVKLSEQRAASVASYLIRQKIRLPERIITRGFGSSKPVASNTTEEGRQKNRRVEITILEN